jgi:serine/threonine protein kinase
MLTRRIGRGGFSEVRLGKLRSNRSCRFAVKVVDLKKPKAQRIGRQPYWEIDLLKKLENSENVIQIFDFSKIIENDCLFMVLELGGQSLDMVHKNFKRGKQIKPSYCRKRFRQCVVCVQQVHDFGKFYSFVEFLVINLIFRHFALRRQAK